MCEGGSVCAYGKAVHGSVPVHVYLGGVGYLLPHVNGPVHVRPMRMHLFVCVSICMPACECVFGGGGVHVNAFAHLCV